MILPETEDMGCAIVFFIVAENRLHNFDVLGPIKMMGFTNGCMIDDFCIKNSNIFIFCLSHL